MTALIPPANPGWPDVTRFEITERLLGGDGGPLNRAPLELLERSEYLKKKIDDAVSGALTFEYANRLKTTRSIAMTGDGSWGVTFDGSGNVTAAMTLANTGVAAGTYQVVTVDSKGRATDGRALTAADIPPLDWKKITTGKPTTVDGYGITDGATKTDAANAAPPGAVAYFAMQAAPAGWIKANGAAVSRTAYAALFAAITLQTTGSTTSGNATITGMASTAGMAIGMPVSGPGIPIGAKLTAVTANSVTLSANATATADGVPIVVAPFGVGDGSTTFNVPDLRGEFVRGWDDGRGVDGSRLLGTPQAATQMIADAMCVGIGNGLGPVVDKGYLQTGFDATVQAFNGLAAYHIPNNWVPPQGQPGGNEKVPAVVTTGSVRPRNTALLACIKF